MFNDHKHGMTRTVLLAVCLAGCVVQTSSDDQNEAEVSVAGSDEALWSNPDKGALTFRQTRSGTLTNGDFSHYYKFVASAGQTVTFAVEWKLPESNALGAVIGIKNASGTRTLTEHATLSSNQAHVVYTFQAAGTYRIYVKHYGYALFGAYPYKVGAEPDLCSVWEGTYDGFEQGIVNFTSATNFPESLTSDPWTTPHGFGEEYEATSHTVAFGNCSDLVSSTCGSAGPAVFEVWFPTGSLEVVPNACEMRNDVYETAGTADTWGLWWDTCTRYPEACPEL